MAETVYLSDGSMEVIFGDKADFLQRLIRDKLGNDAEHCLLEYINDLQEVQKEHDLASQEAERIADGYLSMCRDAMETFAEIIEALSDERLNRKKLMELAQQGFRQLHNNL